MKKIFFSLIIGFFFISQFVLAESSKPHDITFESAEHIFMGDQVILYGLGQKTSDQPIKLTLPNGLQLSYGEILAMPDYYGDPDHAISSEITAKNCKERFNAIFSSFANDNVQYFNAFWPIIQNERALVMQAVKAHEDVSQVYAKINDQEDIDLTVATNFKYLDLSLTGFDHFNQDAITAYQAGHAVAIDMALLGFQIKSGNNVEVNAYCQKNSNYLMCLQEQAKNKLILAYAQNAFASHFLSDRFAAGHMRTPYRALYETRPIAIMGALSGHLMHGEDNRLGVIVTNSGGQYWIAYGDEYYFSTQNATSRKILKTTLQASADEINDAFQSGVNPDPHSEKIIALIPVPIQPGQTVNIMGVGNVQQTAPLYQMVLGTVWQRIDVNNKNDDQWTPIWSTLLTLLTYHSPDQVNVPVEWQMILTRRHMNDVLWKLGIH